MHVELIDRLRCAATHEESWLVAAAVRTERRHIMEGSLGCPVCGAEYPIRDGAVRYPLVDPVPTDAAVRDEAAGAIRLAALLAMDGRGGLYVLGGAWGVLAGALAEYAGEHLLLIAPPPVPPPASIVRGVGDTLPLAAGCAAGIALDRMTPALAAAAVRVLAPGGRLVAPAGTPPPEGITVLAGDDRQWVAERAPTESPPVPLRRSGAG